MLDEGVIRAGLCGDPMPITNGILEAEALLSFRSGGDAVEMGLLEVLDPVELALGRSMTGAIGDGGFMGTSPSSLPGTGGACCTLDVLELFREREGRNALVCSFKDRFSASARTSVRGGLDGPGVAVRRRRGNSKRPYRGRGGLSGIALPTLESGKDAERSLPCIASFTPNFDTSSSSPVGSTDMLTVAYEATVDSLILRRVLCLCGDAGVFKGKFVNKSPSFPRSGDGG